MSRQTCSCGATFERTLSDLHDAVAEKKWMKLHAGCVSKQSNLGEEDETTQE